jgi:hypothetical protein
MAHTAPIGKSLVDVQAQLHKSLDSKLEAITAKHQPAVVLPRRATVDRLTISQSMMRYGMVPLETMRTVNNAIDQDDYQTIAGLADEMREMELKCLPSELEAALNRAMVKKKSREVKLALAKFPPGVPLERLFAGAAEDNDLELVKYLLGQGIKPTEPGINCLARMRQFLRDAMKAYTLSEGAQTALEAAVRQAEKTDRMVQTMKEMVIGEDNAELYENMIMILTSGNPNEQSQILKCFVQAGDVREYLEHKSEEGDKEEDAPTVAELYKVFDNILMETGKRLAPPTGEPKVAAIHGSIQGILQGIASTPELPGQIRDALMDQVTRWLGNDVAVPDQSIPAFLADIRQLMQAVPAEQSRLYKGAEAVAHIRRISATLDQITNDELSEHVKKIRPWMKHLPAHFQDSFAQLMRQIDQRNPAIGAIPEIAIIDWVGRQINGSELNNISGFLRFNPNYTLFIDTDRVDSTSKAIDSFVGDDEETRALFERVRIRNVEEILPDIVTDSTKTRMVTKEEIRKVLALEMYGPGKRFSAVSDLLRLCGLRSEKEIQGQKLRGGVYFDVDLQWYAKLPYLSSSLGIAINRGSDKKLNNNFIGCPHQDIEVIDQFIVDLVYAYRREQRNVETQVNDIKNDYPDLAKRVGEMHQEYVAKKKAEMKAAEKAEQEGETHASSKADLKPLDGEELYYFKEEITPEDGQEKQTFYAASKQRAREILQEIHPSENPMDYARHVHAIEKNVSTRFAFTLALSGPVRFRTSMIDMFGPFWFLNEDLCQLGKWGGMAHQNMVHGQIFTEVSDAEWATKPLGRRASVAGSTPKGELYYDEDYPSQDFYDAQYGD